MALILTKEAFEGKASFLVGKEGGGHLTVSLVCYSVMSISINQTKA